VRCDFVPRISDESKAESTAPAPLAQFALQLERRLVLKGKPESRFNAATPGFIYVYKYDVAEIPCSNPLGSLRPFLQAAGQQNRILAFVIVMGLAGYGSNRYAT
jgi:hypothetical protein